MKKSNLPFLILIGLTFIFFGQHYSATAQDATIKGFVYEKETSEPVIFTNVYLKKTQHGAATDANGFFVISQVPPGNYFLTITSIGYDSISIPITVKPNQVLNQKIYLQKASYFIQGVNITAEREEARTETKTSVTKVTPKQLKQIPTVGGQADLAQYLQVLPGVVFTGDQGGQLYIRGGAPIQNKVLLDGMVIYNPFHSIGLFSVFETDILRSADVYTGGFGAEYGGRISSVMDITTREGNKKRLSGKIAASTFGANVLLEGPIVREKKEGDASTSFLISFKNSYLEQTSKSLYKYVDKNGLPFNYNDLYSKISINGQNGSKVNFFGFSFNDQVNNYKSLADFNWKSYGFGSNFVLVPANAPMIMEGIFAFSDYKITLEDQVNLPKTSNINGFNLGLYFTYIEGKNQLKYGFELQGFKTDFNFYNSANRQIAQTENTTEVAAYFKYKISAGKFLIEPSFRAQYYASLSELSPEPRLAVKFLATKKLRIKFATGLYSQNLLDAKSDRDVVNLFYGFLSGPDNLPETFQGEKVDSKLQKSQHAILGFEYDVNDRTTINVEGYYKYFNQLTSINRNKIFEDNSDFLTKPDYLKKDYIIENGDAYGVDFTAKYDYNKLYVWFVYSLGWVKRTDELQTYYPHYDRRHNINILVSYVLNDRMDWQFDIRWNFGSGFAYTKAQGIYEKLNFTDGIYTDYTTSNGQLGVLYAGLNEGRLPYYHRLDFTLKKKWVLGKYSNLEGNISITNVYNRENMFYFDLIKYERINQLPFMPSVGLSLTF